MVTGYRRPEFISVQLKIFAHIHRATLLLTQDNDGSNGNQAN
jgi:hypothetical protein